MTKLDEYFDRARREQPPLQKNDVSSILAEMLAMRPLSDDAHRRRKLVLPRGVGRFFSLLSPKGWIMFSMLTATLVAFFLTFPNTRNNAPSGVIHYQQPHSQSLQQQEPQTTKPHITKLHARKPQAPINQASSNQVAQQPSTQAIDSLPAPYDFVETDESPVIDITTLKQSIQYPEEARKLGFEGKVVIRVLVLQDGSVSPRTFIETSDAKILDSAALRAVFSTTWIPAKHNNKAVACWANIPIVFRNPERSGKKSVTKAQILTLSDAELQKIGVQRDTADILQVVGWNKAHTKLYQMQTSIREALPYHVFGVDSIFKQYVANLRKEGKFARAAEWEQRQQERRKRFMRDLLADSSTSKISNSIANIVTAEQKQAASKQDEHLAELREQARQTFFPRLVTDGHNYRYVVDISDLPELEKERQWRKEREQFQQRADKMKLSRSERYDSLKAIHSRYHNTDLDKRLATTKDSVEIQALVRQINEQRKQQENQFEQEKSDISKLIGIRVQSAQKRTEGDEYLLWYDPTPEFIALLPERYRLGLLREVEAAKKYATTCEIPTEEEKKAVAGYFDSWRSCDGVLKITNLYPNPANIQATVRFTLREARSITLTLHNLNGERLAILEPTPILPAGEHELPLDFTGRNIGVYLLALSTDKGETAIKRVMIVR